MQKYQLASLKTYFFLFDLAFNSSPKERKRKVFRDAWLIKKPPFKAALIIILNAVFSVVL
jgi:hypothetical protein